MSKTSELSYLTQIVLKVFQKSKSASTMEDYEVEIHFNPGLQCVKNSVGGIDSELPPLRPLKTEMPFSDVVNFFDCYSKGGKDQGSELEHSLTRLSEMTVCQTEHPGIGTLDPAAIRRASETVDLPLYAANQKLDNRTRKWSN